MIILSCSRLDEWRSPSLQTYGVAAFRNLDLCDAYQSDLIVHCLPLLDFINYAHNLRSQVWAKLLYCLAFGGTLRIWKGHPFAWRRRTSHLGVRCLNRQFAFSTSLYWKLWVSESIINRVETVEDILKSGRDVLSGHWWWGWSLCVGKKQRGENFLVFF